MVRKQIHEDIEFIKKEWNVLVNFLRKYFNETSEDAQKDQTVAMLEYGPFKLGRLGVVVAITIILVVRIAMYGSHITWWMGVLIFLALHDLMFERSWTIPILEAVWGVIKGLFESLFGLFSSGGGGDSKPDKPADKGDKKDAAPKK